MITEIEAHIIMLYDFVAPVFAYHEKRQMISLRICKVYIVTELMTHLAASNTTRVHESIYCLEEDCFPGT